MNNSKDARPAHDPLAASLMTAESRAHQNQRMWPQWGIVPAIRFEKHMYSELPLSATGFGERGLSGSAREPSA